MWTFYLIYFLANLLPKFQMYSGMKEEVRMSYQDQLVDVIMRVLVANEELYYYQVSLTNRNPWHLSIGVEKTLGQLVCMWWG